MSKITVAYWSGTGNTEAMAEAVGEGIKAAGKECAVVSISDISASDLHLLHSDARQWEQKY